MCIVLYTQHPQHNNNLTLLLLSAKGCLILARIRSFLFSIMEATNNRPIYYLVCIFSTHSFNFIDYWNNNKIFLKRTTWKHLPHMIHQITLTCWIGSLLNLSLKWNIQWRQSLTCWVDEVSEYSQGAYSVSLIIVFKPLQDKHHQSVWERFSCIKDRQRSKYDTRTRTHTTALQYTKQQCIQIFSSIHVLSNEMALTLTIPHSNACTRAAKLSVNYNDIWFWVT